MKHAQTIKTPIKLALSALLVFGMGIAMPSCPGQQAMQQQIETLQSLNVDLTKKNQELSNQLHSLSTDMSQVKQLLPQMTNVIKAQKDTLEHHEAAIKELQTKGKSTKSAGKKKK